MARFAFRRSGNNLRERVGKRALRAYDRVNGFLTFVKNGIADLNPIISVLSAATRCKDTLGAFQYQGHQEGYLLGRSISLGLLNLDHFGGQEISLRGACRSPAFLGQFSTLPTLFSHGQKFPARKSVSIFFFQAASQ